MAPRFGFEKRGNRFLDPNSASLHYGLLYIYNWQRNNQAIEAKNRPRFVSVPGNKGARSEVETVVYFRSLFYKVFDP